MAELTDLNNDGVINFKDEELAAVEAAKERLRKQKEAQQTRPSTGPSTEETPLQKRNREQREREAQTRRDNEARQSTPKRTVDPSPLRPVRDRLAVIDQAVEEAVTGDRRNNQSTNQNN